MQFFSKRQKKPAASPPLVRRPFLLGGILLLLMAGLWSQARSYWPAAAASVQVLFGRELPVYSVETDQKQAALSFDAAWGNEDTAEILDILEKYDVKVTFFMTGQWVKDYPDDVKRIAELGHDLGNHSENHQQMSQLSETEIRQEIQSVHDEVKELTGIEMDLFRPPYGDYNDTLVSTVREMGYQCVQWNVDSLDWKDYGADSIVKTVCNHKNLCNGSIILLHNGAKYTPEALEAVITGLQAQGYELVPISQLICTGEYTIDHTGRQIPQ